MRSLILFAAIQALAFFLGSSDTAAISLIVFGIGCRVVCTLHTYQPLERTSEIKRI